MQGYLRSRLPTDVERFIYMGNNKIAPVKAIGLFKLQLETDFYLGLYETYYVLSFR